MTVQDTAAAINAEPQLVGMKTGLNLVFPDPETRPSIRAFNSWKQRGWGIILQERTKLSVHEKRKSIFRLGLESLLELFNSQSLPNFQIHEPSLEREKRLKISEIIVM